MERNLYLIQSGAVRAYYNSEEEEHDIRFGYQGSVINSISSFINEIPSTLSVQAIRKTKALVLDKDSYMKFIMSSNDNMKMHLVVMEQLVDSMLEREIDLLTSSPKDRYDRVSKRSPQLFQHIPLKYIASYLRMTPETLSRLRKS